MIHWLINHAQNKYHVSCFFQTPSRKWKTKWLCDWVDSVSRVSSIATPSKTSIKRAAVGFNVQPSVCRSALGYTATAEHKMVGYDDWMVETAGPKGRSIARCLWISHCTICWLCTWILSDHSQSYILAICMYVFIYIYIISYYIHHIICTYIYIHHIICTYIYIYIILYVYIYIIILYNVHIDMYIYIHIFVCIYIISIYMFAFSVQFHLVPWFSPKKQDKQWG